MTTDHLLQAQAFTAWYRKLAHTPWDEAWQTWTDSKQFSDEDRRAIRRLVYPGNPFLAGNPDAVSTDPFDFLSTEEAA